MTLDDLLPDVLGRIEEADPPIFWNLVGEVYPLMVDGMYEAAIVTGTNQLNSTVVNLAGGTTYFDVPKGCFGPLRMKAAYNIRKTTLKGLDDMIPKWQQATPSSQLIAWFPLGVNKFGIYPQLNADAQVVMDFIYSPVNQARPLNGTVAVPFQDEFSDLFSEYGAAMLRAKEGGAEAEEASTVYQEYMEKLKGLSLFQSRLDELVMTGTWGGKVQVNQRKTV